MDLSGCNPKIKRKGKGRAGLLGRSFKERDRGRYRRKVKAIWGGDVREIDNAISV